MADRIRALWEIWSSDGLRSVGALFPVAAIGLSLHAWRGQNWTNSGTWWGLLLIAAVIVAANLASNSPAGLSLPIAGFISMPSTGLLLWTYVGGAVLLCGGAKAWRSAIFPLALLLFVNPLPQFFPAVIDLHLQYMAAHIARSFAYALGVPVLGAKLALMFSPRFGMFIAPACNGLRGAVAMGFIALVLGYVSELGAVRHIAYVIGAVIVGYALNLVRLCGLVLFYWLALRVQSFRGHAVGADYFIGGLLFFLAATFLSAVCKMNRGRTGGDGPADTGRLAEDAERLAEEDAEGLTEIDRLETTQSEHDRPRDMRRPLTRLAALSAMLLFFVAAARVGQLNAAYSRNIAGRVADDASGALLPAAIGPYRIASRWRNDPHGWEPEEGALYSRGAGADPVQLDLRLNPARLHNGVGCYLVSGEMLTSERLRTVRTADTIAAFDVAFTSDGDGIRLVAATECFEQACAETRLFGWGIVMPQLTLKSLLVHAVARPARPLVAVSIMMNRKIANSNMRFAQSELFAQFAGFASALNLADVREFAGRAPVRGE
jgi:exosortase/archaeosortase family protein